MRQLLLLTAAGSALQRPMVTLRQTAHGLAAKTVAREDATTSRLLALEAERRELQARLAANEERQRALALGKDVEPKPPRVLKTAASSSCGIETCQTFFSPLLFRLASSGSLSAS